MAKVKQPADFRQHQMTMTTPFEDGSEADTNAASAISLLPKGEDEGVVTSSRFRSSVADIAEAADLEWNDDFYNSSTSSSSSSTGEQIGSDCANSSSSMDNDDDIVAVFDIHYNRLVNRLRQAKYMALGMSIVLLGIAIFYPAAAAAGEQDHPSVSFDEGNRGACFPLSAGMAFVFVGMWFYETREEKRIRGRHVAVTRQGIRRDSNNEDGVQTTTLLPFSRIRSIENRSPVLCNNNSAYSVDLIEIRLNKRLLKPIEIEGLVNSGAFIKLVLAMKKSSKEQSALGGVLNLGVDDDYDASDVNPEFQQKSSEV